MQYNIEKKLTIEFYPREKIIYMKKRGKKFYIDYRSSHSSKQNAIDSL